MNAPRTTFALAAAAVLAMGGLFAWASAPGHVETDAPKLAVVDILEISQRLYSSDRYAPAREAIVKTKRGELEAMGAGLSELSTKIQAVGQNSPDGQALIPTFEAKQREMQKFQQGAKDELSQLMTRQFAESYRLAADAAVGVAKARGFTHVITSRSGSFELRSADLQSALQEVFARPVLAAPEGDDITAAVIAELKIPATPDVPANPVEQPKADKPGEKPADKK